MRALERSRKFLLRSFVLFYPEKKWQDVIISKIDHPDNSPMDVVTFFYNQRGIISAGRYVEAFSTFGIFVFRFSSN